MAGTKVCDHDLEGPQMKPESWFGPDTEDLECCTREFGFPSLGSASEDDLNRRP